MTKHVVRICYDVPGWAYHRRAQALQKYAPDDFEVTTGPDYGRAFRQKEHHLVLQLCYPYVEQIRKHIKKGGYKMRLAAGFNVAWEARDGWFKRCRQYANHVIINSQMCWEKAGRPEDTSWISNGVDREVFKLDVLTQQRKPRVLWVGSSFHRRNKGFDTILQPMKLELRKRGIDCDFRLTNSHGRHRMSPAQMNEYYNTGTIYVCASKHEGTPNPALEAASAGCVLVSTAVGNMPELIEHGVNGELVPRDLNPILRAIVRCQDRYEQMSAAMQTAIAPWHWKVRAQQYYDLFRRLIG